MDRDVNWLPRDPDWRMTVLFLGFVGTLGLAMKLTTLLIRNRSLDHKSLFWFTLLAAPNSLPRCRPLTELRGLLVRASAEDGANEKAAESGERPAPRK